MMDCVMPGSTRMVPNNEQGMNQMELHQRLQFFSQSSTAPTPPEKIMIGNPGLVETFRRSYSFAKILFYTEACAESIRGTRFRDRRTLRPTNPSVKYITETFFPSLHGIIDRVPLSPASEQRYGNPAKRLFHDHMERELTAHMENLVQTFPPVVVLESPSLAATLNCDAAVSRLGSSFNEASPVGSPVAMVQPYRVVKTKQQALQEQEDAQKVASSSVFQLPSTSCSSLSVGGITAPYESSVAMLTPSPKDVGRRSSGEASLCGGAAGGVPIARPRTREEMQTLAAELAEYIKDSFGNARRLDYGSGHELHFFIFMMICLEEHRDLGGLIDHAKSLAAILQLCVPPPPVVPEALADEVCCRRQEFMFFVFRDYMTLMRRIETHYRLEPAGSHGVWGLDDYHHLPYVFGAAQLTCFDPVALRQRTAPPSPQTAPLPRPKTPPHSVGGSGGVMSRGEEAGTENISARAEGRAQRHSNPAIDLVSSTPPTQPPPLLADAAPTRSSRRSSSGSLVAPQKVFLPADVCDKEKVSAFQEDFFYPNMIFWINTHKRGPFHEHSNMLYNISSVATWEKTYSGMMKMFAAEVLSKFNVSQHLLFGQHLPWRTKVLGDIPAMRSATVPASASTGSTQQRVVSGAAAQLPPQVQHK